ncbi:wd40 protein ciao1 [Anaeramoeba flamelloides]|uniref:Probable cytosolic iron-sulfur protein assembly protein CIAO1 homolog n=1 Tax=Anaeramoeba flamelloides TaxID=1746091 RepID=A0AAV7Z926_9EUKA|nr:wd40 protein ciao1 [Anaeramoeba flamelloides]
MALNLVSTLEGHEDIVWQVAWNGSILSSCGSDLSVRIWQKESETTEYECTCILGKSHERTIRSLQWSFDGEYLATASFDSTVNIWKFTPSSKSNDNEDSFECVSTLKGQEKELKSVCWSPIWKNFSLKKQYLACCSRDHSVWIWEKISSDDFEISEVLEGHEGDVKHVAFSPTEPILASSSYDNSVRIWSHVSLNSDKKQKNGNLKGGELLDELAEEMEWKAQGKLSDHTNIVRSTSFSADGKILVSVSADRSLIIYEKTEEQETKKEEEDEKEKEKETNKEEEKEKDEEYKGKSALYEFSSDIQSTAGWVIRQKIENLHERNIMSVDIKKDDEKLTIATCGEDDCIHILQEDEKNVIQKIISIPNAHKSDINCVTWGENNLLASCGDDRLVKIWKFEN